MAETVNLPNPKDRNLFFNRQVNQSSVNDLCKDLVDISEHDQYIKDMIDQLIYTIR